MKNALLLSMAICFFFAGQTDVFAQKAKFKNKYTTVQKTRLPINFIDADKRTYDLYAKGSYAHNIDVHQKRIYGWKHDAENPNVKGVVSIYGFSTGSPKLNKEKKTKKDKEGNVTDTASNKLY